MLLNAVFPSKFSKKCPKTAFLTCGSKVFVQFGRTKKRSAKFSKIIENYPLKKFYSRLCFYCYEM